MCGGWVRRSVEKSQELHRMECFQKLGIVGVVRFFVVFGYFSPSQGGIEWWVVVGFLRHSFGWKRNL